MNWPAGLDDFLAAAVRLLRDGGRFYVVFLAERLAELLEQMRHRQLEPKRLRCVHGRSGEAARMVLVEGRKRGGPGLRIEPPLYIRDGEEYSPEVLALYEGRILSRPAAGVQLGLAAQQVSQALAQLGIGQLGDGGGDLVFGGGVEGLWGGQRRGRLGDRERGEPAAPQKQVAEQRPPQPVIELGEELWFQQLQLLHPDRLVDLDLEYAVADAAGLGMGGDLRSDDLVPDLPGAVLAQAIAHPALLQNALEDAADAGSLAQPGASGGGHQRARRLKRPPTTWPTTAQPRVKGMTRQLKPETSRRAMTAGIERWM